MDDQLWNLFRETGEPMSYLLYKAEKNRKKKETDKAKSAKPNEETPPASA